jgi:hypothetical protein
MDNDPMGNKLPGKRGPPKGRESDVGLEKYKIVSKERKAQLIKEKTILEEQLEILEKEKQELQILAQTKPNSIELNETIATVVQQEDKIGSELDSIQKKINLNDEDLSAAESSSSSSSSS